MVSPLDAQGRADKQKSAVSCAEGFQPLCEIRTPTFRRPVLLRDGEPHAGGGLARLPHDTSAPGSPRLEAEPARNVADLQRAGLLADGFESRVVQCRVTRSRVRARLIQR